MNKEEKRKDIQKYNRPEQKDLRQQLRNGGEAPEAVMWTFIKNRQLDGMKFRRQFGVGPYVLDFYCPEIKLGIAEGIGRDAMSHTEDSASQGG